MYESSRHNTVYGCSAITMTRCVMVMKEESDLIYKPLCCPNARAKATSHAVGEDKRRFWSVYSIKIDFCHRVSLENSKCIWRLHAAKIRLYVQCPITASVVAHLFPSDSPRCLFIRISNLLLKHETEDYDWLPSAATEKLDLFGTFEMPMGQSTQT